MVKRYKKLKYHQFTWLIKLLAVLLAILVGSIYINQWLNLKGLITITGIGVLSLIVIALVRWEHIKYAFLIEKFIISNDLLQYHWGMWGKKNIDYYPNIVYKVVNNYLFVRFRLDGSRIAQHFYNLEQPLADYLKTLCTDIIVVVKLFCNTTT